MGDQAHRPAEGLRPRLILIKHGMPVLEPGRPPSTWALSEEGRLASRDLAGRLAPLEPRSIVASLERKAIQTAEAMAGVLGLAVERDAGLGEQMNEHGPFVDQAVFQASVARMFARPRNLVMGEETGDEACDRFAAAVDRQLTAHPKGPLAVVSHGRVITLWMNRRFGIEPMSFWRGLGLATAVVIADDGFTLVGGY